MIFVYGFGGMRDYGGQLRFSPRMPLELERLRVRLIYRGQVLAVEMDQERTHYTLCEGAGLTIRHEDQDILLTPEHAVSVQRNATRSGRAS